MSSHTTDWFPGRVSKDYRENWERIFAGETDDKKKVDRALKMFKQGGCCNGSCNCSNKKV